MHIRVFRFNVRNPLIGAFLLIAAVGFLLAAVAFGLTLLLGAVAVGGLALLARRILRFGRRQPPPLEPLDTSREVFPPERAREQLPSDKPREDELL
ncbi:MAG TPA: hypothetical protein VMM17_11400 [Gemmatimonadaceae bacterium]|nr:hypothetical protein [Gemmatimonadaceae bacterium]